MIHGLAAEYTSARENSLGQPARLRWSLAQSVAAGSGPNGDTGREAASQCASTASISSATMLVILIIGFTAGPAVSL